VRRALVVAALSMALLGGCGSTATRTTNSAKAAAIAAALRAAEAEIRAERKKLGAYVGGSTTSVFQNDKRLPDLRRTAQGRQQGGMGRGRQKGPATASGRRDETLLRLSRKSSRRGTGTVRPA
jgi:hypothetical protein